MSKTPSKVSKSFVRRLEKTLAKDFKRLENSPLVKQMKPSRRSPVETTSACEAEDHRFDSCRRRHIRNKIIHQKISDYNHELEHPGDPLDILAEECAEVIQAIMKIKRFGVRQRSREDFVKEAGDLLFAIDRVIDKTDLLTKKNLSEAKKAKVKRFKELFGKNAT